MNKPKDLNQNHYDLMEKGMCPVCSMHISKHSDKKRNICKSVMRDRYSLPEPFLVLEDGRKVRMRITKPTHQEKLKHAEKSYNENKEVMEKLDAEKKSKIYDPVNKCPECGEFLIMVGNEVICKKGHKVK